MTHISEDITHIKTFGTQWLEKAYFSNENDVDLDPPVPVIKDFKEAIQTLEHVQHFLESRNYLEMATKTSVLVTEVAAHQVSAMHQTTLTQFFSARAENTDI